MRSSIAFVAGLALAAALPVLGQQAAQFTDVPPDASYAPAVRSLAQMGVVRGYENGAFGPSDPLTRSQVAQMLWRYDQERVQPLWDAVQPEQNEEGTCEPYRCPDGTRVDACTDDGQVINYVADPCLGHEAQAGEGCRIGGCSNQICTEEGSDDIVSTCEWRDEYACYRSATCEKQADGACGWTETDELTRCLEDPSSEGEDASCAAVLCMQGTMCRDGECIPLTTSSCGDGMCSADETRRTCPQDCSPRAPGPSSASSRSPASSAPTDEESEQAYCPAEYEDFEDAVAANQSCQTDDDCMLYVDACPFVTCGVAINQSASGTVAAAAGDYLACKDASGAPVACASCIRQSVSCQQGKCVA